MSSLHQYRVKANGIDEKLNLVLKIKVDSLKVSIDYKNITYVHTSPIKQMSGIDIDTNKKFLLGNDISPDLYRSLENNNTEVDFNYDKKSKTSVFYIRFNISRFYCESIVLEQNLTEKSL